LSSYLSHRGETRSWGAMFSISWRDVMLQVPSVVSISTITSVCWACLLLLPFSFIHLIWGLRPSLQPSISSWIKHSKRRIDKANVVISLDLGRRIKGVLAQVSFQRGCRYAKGHVPCSDPSSASGGRILIWFCRLSVFDVFNYLQLPRLSTSNPFEILAFLTFSDSNLFVCSSVFSHVQIV